MSTKAARTFSTEKERREKIDEMIAEYGPKWGDQYKPGSYGCHELLDRTHLAADIVEQFVLSHPACAQKREWYALADRAVAALCELYQRIGAEHLSEEKDEG